MPLVREWGWSARREAGWLREHVNRGYEVTFATEGEFTWEIVSGPRLRLTGGHVCLTQPDLAHCGAQELMTPGTLFYLVVAPRARGARRHTPFEPDQLARIDRALSQAGNAVTRADPYLPALFESLRRAFADLDARRDETLLLPWTRALVCQILLATVRSFRAPAPEPSSPPVRRAIRFLEAHLAEELPMARLAAEAGLNRSRFYETFRQETGLTPADFLQRRRCARAAQLLRETDQPVTAIALDCGFRTSQYFARCFRKYAGLAPSAFRSRSRAS